VTPPNPSATNAPEVCCPQAGQAPTTPECSVNGQVDAGNSTAPRQMRNSLYARRTRAVS